MVLYSEMKISWHNHMLTPRKPLLALLNQPLRYHLDTMV